MAHNGNNDWTQPAALALPKEGYFEQFLAWFGGAVMAGRFTNVWDEMQHPLAAAPGQGARGTTGQGNLQVTPFRGYDADGKRAKRANPILNAVGGTPSQRSPTPVFLFPNPGVP